MLVLSRKETQRIRLGDSIVVTVVRVSGDKVRLGIEAPADLLVLRDELESREAGQFGMIEAEVEVTETVELSAELETVATAQQQVA